MGLEIEPVAIKDIELAWNALQKCPAVGVKTVRTFDGLTPLAIHTIHAMSSIALESELPVYYRFLGQHVLLWHDVLEDTTFSLPNFLHPEVIRLVDAMTFKGGSREEIVELFNRDRLVWLYKLYDKYSNLVDGLGPNGWMRKKEKEQPGYIKNYYEFAVTLSKRVEQDVLPSISESPVLLKICPAISSLKQYL